MPPFSDYRDQRAAQRAQVLELLATDEVWANMPDDSQELALERVSAAVEDQLNHETDARLVRRFDRKAGAPRLDRKPPLSLVWPARGAR